jgi:two-component sensor histidine kinase
MEQIHLSLDQAIPCGLIVNELVSNALKYAFSEHNKNGEISIELRIKENRIILMIGYNGVGLPQDFDVEKTETLGLQLVLTLIDQLDAIIEIKRQDGTKYFITFDVLKA